MAGERILVVEDNAINAKLIVFLLTAHGYKVTHAIDAAAAKLVLGCQRPDLVLVDLQLPGIDGLEIVRLLRDDETYLGLPIIAVTAYAMKGDREKGLEAGCDDYVTKPIDTRALPALIARILERQHS